LVKPEIAASMSQPSSEIASQTPETTSSQFEPGSTASAPPPSGADEATYVIPSVVIPSPTVSVSPTGVVSATPIYVTTPTPLMALTIWPTPSATVDPYRYTPPPWVSSELKASEPEEVQLASGKVQLIEFFAFWCGTCQAMAATVHGLEAQYGEKMNFIYLDIDNPANDQFKEQLHYISQPHFFLVDENGVTLKQWLGYVSSQEFIEAFEFSLK
jgi:thiol-disulfide isomerase/thioredoxin